jgi:hypothetical protein
MTFNLPTTPAQPDLGSPSTYNARALAWFTYLGGDFKTYLDALDANDFFNVLGTVSESGGVPTGSIIERGTNANGDYVRFADGTQICQGRVDTSSSAAVTQTLPAAFFNTGTMKPQLTPITTLIASIAPSIFALTTSSMTLSAYDTTNSRRAVGVEFVIHGRWF